MSRQTGLGIGGMPTYDHKAILTPPELYARLNEEFHFDFDPCPYPRPEGFDGLKVPWGKSNWVNPIFWRSAELPKGKGGISSWARKALSEATRGNLTVFAFPLNAWEGLMLEHIGCPDLRVPRDWYWVRPDGKRHELSRPIVLWVIRPKALRRLAEKGERDTLRAKGLELVNCVDRLLDCDLDRVCAPEAPWPPPNYEHIGEVERAIASIRAALAEKGEP